MDFSKLPVLNKLSPRQYEVIAYLISGGWNTFFGMGLYTIVYWLWGGKVHYMILTIPVNIAAITNAFLCYKLFVFRTKGNWLKEYLKCYLVYGTGMLSGMGLLWILVSLFKINPAVGNVIATGLVATASYFGHKYFSFRKGK